MKGSIIEKEEIKGYGFIRQEDIFDKIFFHFGAVQGSFKDLKVNDKVDFKIVRDTKGYRAVNIIKLN